MANFVHTVRITDLKKKISYNGQSDVICHAQWRLESYRDDYPDEKVDFMGATPFRVSAADLSAENFTSFDQVTEAQIISWVEANAWNLGELKLQNENKINDIIEPKEVQSTLPWDPNYQVTPRAGDVVDPDSTPFIDPNG